MQRLAGGLIPSELVDPSHASPSQIFTDGRIVEDLGEPGSDRSNLERVTVDGSIARDFPEDIDIGCDHWNPRGHGLQQGVAKGLQIRWEDEDV